MRPVGPGEILLTMLLLSVGGRQRCIRAFQTAAPFYSRSSSMTTMSHASSTATTTRLFMSTIDTSDLEARIKAKGDEIREMKENGADKAAVAPFVEELLALKAQLNPESASKEQNKKQQKPKKQQQNNNYNSNNNNESSDFITPRSEDYSKWYNDIIKVADLAASSPVRGCMVVRPWGMSIWDNIRNHLDHTITQVHGAQNAYFPLLVPVSFLSKEAEHVDGFAKECAVVTHHRLVASSDNNDTPTLIADPEAQLEDPLVIRPTSETIIWSMFRKWINSYRDLPLKMNQWANVLRWEMRTRPFLRTSEFLWQEGHTAHATAESAIEDAEAMIGHYRDLAVSQLAMPVVVGAKSPAERFAGATETYTIEALMQNGWALQSGTSHFLGKSFGNAFDVKFQDENGEQQSVWGTSWGVSTRLIGALIMTHSDDAGLVLPPRIAPTQIVIVPIMPKKSDVEGTKNLNKAIDDLTADLKKRGLRVKVDDRDYIRNGAKYFEWERKGVPLRIELGPRDLEKGKCVFKYRTIVEDKQFVDLDSAGSEAFMGLERFHDALYEAAKERLDSGINFGATYEEMKTALEADEASSFAGPGLYLVPWKCNTENEDKIKEECKATIRCYPLAENKAELWKGLKCFYSGEEATHMALFGRAF